MNEFTKQWLTSTLAPDSIRNIKGNDLAHLDAVANETRTIAVFVLSTDEEVLSIGTKYEDLLVPHRMTFREAIRKCAELLQLAHFSV